MYPALCKVETIYYDGEKAVCEERAVVLYCNSFTHAMEQLEKYYGNEMEQANIKLYSDSLIEFPVEEYNKLNKMMGEYV